MKDIFATFTYACEKISENGVLKAAGYSEIKRMVSECVVFFEARYGSVNNVDFIKYHLDEIQELYSLFDSGLEINEANTRNLVEKHLFQNLICHVTQIKDMYEEDA